MYKIVYGNLVSKQELKKFSVEILKEIQKQIFLKLTKNPEEFGKPLRKSLKGYRRLRIRDFRVIFKINIKLQQVEILFIGKNPEVYEYFLAKNN